MTITDKQRTEVHICLRDLMGQEMADIMMELLPPVGWGEVVRRQDVNALGVSLRAEMSETRADLRREIQDVQLEVQAVRHELKSEIQDVRLELKSEIQDVRLELKSEIQDARLELSAEIQDGRLQVQEVRSELATFQGVTDANFVRVESKLDNITAVLEAMERRITFAINAGLVVIVAFAGALWQLK